MATTKVTKLSSKKLRELIGFEPHEKQWDILRAISTTARFITMCWGRRSGKTLLVAYIAIRYLLTNHAKLNAAGEEVGREGNTIWIVAPTLDLAQRSWDYLMEWIPFLNKHMGKAFKINKSNLTIECKISGSKLFLKTSDNPVSLLGAGLDLLIVDEAALIQEDIWQTYLKPTLVDRGGRAIFVSTPRGKNWFYNMMLKGIDEAQKYADYMYSHMRTSDNPRLPNIDREMELARMEMPLNQYMQEHEAEFIDGSGTVFRGVRDVLYETNFTSFPWHAEEYNQDHVYQGGTDLARLHDFTVQTIIDKSLERFKVTSIDRFNEVDWKLQKPRLSLHSEKYRNPIIHLELNNIGDTIISDMPGNYQGFKTTGGATGSKQDIINNLAILIEQRKIMIPNIPVLVDELEAYTYEITSSGNVKYMGRQGHHDDMVMSLAIACYGLKEPILGAPVDEYLPPSSFIEEEY